MKSGHLDHIDLRVRDIERAQKFYVPVLMVLEFTGGLNSQKGRRIIFP